MLYVTTLLYHFNTANSNISYTDDIANIDDILYTVIHPLPKVRCPEMY